MVLRRRESCLKTTNVKTTKGRSIFNATYKSRCGCHVIRNSKDPQVTYLRQIPSPEHKVKYQTIDNHPAGTLFGRAIVHLSSSFPESPKLEYFKISDDIGTKTV